MTLTYRDWLRSQVEAEDYWFLQIDLGDGLVTPGWSNPKSEKLPYFGLPEDMSGMRVLDIGCAEGFFSFEAERRGAYEVVAIDSFPDSIRRFNICRNALNSKVTALVTSVYDLDPRTFGTFDLVMFFGVLYHLRHPLLSLQKVAAVTAGTLLLQTRTFESAALSNEPVARFRRGGVRSGPPDNPIHDPTVVWEPNKACIRDMLLHVGLVSVEQVPNSDGKLGKETWVNRVRQHSGTTRVGSAVFRAVAPAKAGGVYPTQTGSDGAFGGAGKL